MVNVEMMEINDYHITTFTENVEISDYHIFTS